MSAAALVLAVSARFEEQDHRLTSRQCVAETSNSTSRVSESTAFYRKYTERLLGRYMRASMDMGRCPSVLGNLTFRGKSSHSSGRNFEDSVIFVHDVETCLNRLDRGARELLARIALQDYTQYEVSQMLGTSVRSVMRRYAEALDRLTDILLEVDLLDVPRY